MKGGFEKGEKHKQEVCEDALYKGQGKQQLR